MAAADAGVVSLDAGSDDAGSDDAGSIPPDDGGPRCTQDAGFGPSAWAPPEYVAELNTPTLSGSRNATARLSADELTVHWASTRLGYQEFNVFRATRAHRNERFAASSITRLAVADSFVQGIEFPSETGDGLSLYFVSGRVNAGIWVATRARLSDEFSDPKQLRFNNFATQATVYAVPDGSAIYFSQLGDITRSSRKLERPAAITVGGEVNSPYAEGAPVVTQDEQTLYFGSARDHRDGTYDIFVARRAGDSFSFGDVQKLPATINLRDEHTTQNSPDFITPDGCILYFTRTTNRREEIWRVKRN